MAGRASTEIDDEQGGSSSAQSMAEPAHATNLAEIARFQEDSE